MKTEAKKTWTEKYPCLKADKDESMVVLFSSFRTGTVVHVNNNKLWKVGEWSASWSEKECFHDYDGEITLSN